MSNKTDFLLKYGTPQHHLEIANDVVKAINNKKNQAISYSWNEEKILRKLSSDAQTHVLDSVSHADTREHIAHRLTLSDDTHPTVLDKIYSEYPNRARSIVMNANASPEVLRKIYHAGHYGGKGGLEDIIVHKNTPDDVLEHIAQTANPEHLLIFSYRQYPVTKQTKDILLNRSDYHQYEKNKIDQKLQTK